MAKTRNAASDEYPREELDILRKELRQLLDLATGLAPPPEEEDTTEEVDFFDAVAEYERELIYEALKMADGKLNEAARLLHLRPSTLSMRMKALHMRGPGAADWHSEIH